MRYTSRPKPLPMTIYNCVKLAKVIMISYISMILFISTAHQLLKEIIKSTFKIHKECA